MILVPTFQSVNIYHEVRNMGVDLKKLSLRTEREKIAIAKFDIYDQKNDIVHFLRKKNSTLQDVNFAGMAKSLHPSPLKVG